MTLTYRIRFLSWPWPWNFKVKYGICFISKNGPNATKQKANIGPECDHQIWPWPWPWPWIFKVKNGICYISAKNDPIAKKWKATILIELYALYVTMRFDLCHDIDLEFSMVKYEICYISTKRWSDNHEMKSKNIEWILGVKCDHWPWPWIFKIKFEIAVSQEKEGQLTLNKKGSFMTMTVTFWWPRWGVRIYPIVTGVTSNVGVLSTHLVMSRSIDCYCQQTHQGLVMDEQCGAVVTCSIFCKILTIDTHSSPIRAGYRVPFGSLTLWPLGDLNEILDR